MVGALLCAASVATAQEAEMEAARRVIAMSSLAAKEYAEGVSDGVVVSSAEVEEAVLFLGEARRATSSLPGVIASPIITLIDSALAIVHGTGPSDRVAALTDAVAARLREALDGVDEPIPSLRAPETLGRRLYTQACTECHGDAGTGDGVLARELDPPPADLTDPAMMADQSPLDHFRKIRFGVSGTSMPGFEGTLEDDGIWALAWHVARLRGDEATRARGEAAFARLCPECRTSGLIAAPAALADPVTAAGLNDEELYALVRDLGADGSEAADSAEAAAVVHYLRTLPFAEEYAPGVAGTFASVRTELARALREGRRGQAESASSFVFDAYTGFEQVETEIAVRDGQLAAGIETRFADLRGRVARGDAADDLARSHQLLLGDLQSAQELLESGSSAIGLFFQSLVLLLREGLEAILIVSALATVVAKAGAPERRRDIWWGVGAAVLASVVTAILLETVFRLGVAEQEALEGVTMLVATAVLVFVSHWLLAKVEVNHWKAFVNAKVQRAITSGSMLTLAAAAFLAVYREGFETILFYKALFITADGQGAGAIGGGALLGTVLLVGLYLGIAYAGLRIPMRLFFGVTSAILFYMAFTFAGKGIAELQESQLVSTTLIDWAPSVPWMGIYPTLQTLAIQVGLVALLLFGVLWTFVMQPSRLAARVR